VLAVGTKGRGRDWGVGGRALFFSSAESGFFFNYL
jgi:hypothetical protein